ncbi:MAG: radical SAM protein [Deltaproteobacteria bacterium]|nr:radical SAM protein [Deltaproteobacteria bacterium]
MFKNARDAGSLAFPEHVMIQTTSRCNSACVICPWPDTAKAQAQGDMDDALFASLVDELKTYPNLTRVMMYLMNEPLLDRRMPERIDRVRRALPNAEIYLLTNGILLDRELGDRIIDSGLSWIGLSIHAIDNDTYKNITGRGDFGKIRDRLETFVDRAMAARGGEFVQVNITKVRPLIDDEEFERAAKHWRDLGVRRVDVDQGYISRAGNVDVWGHVQVDVRRTSGCGTLWAYKMAHILFDGDVLPCCMDWRRSKVLGNIREAGSLLDVWRGRGRNAFLDDLGSGEELPEGFLCSRCEDVIPAEGVHVDTRAPVPIPTDQVFSRVRFVSSVVETQSGTTPAAATVATRNGPSRPVAAHTSTSKLHTLLFNPPPWLVHAPPLGIASIAGYLKARGRRVTVMDANVRVYHDAHVADRKLWQWEHGEIWSDAASAERLFGESLRRLAREAAEAEVDVVGVSLVSRKEVPTAIFVRELRRLRPGVHVFVGGPNTSHPDLRAHIRTILGDLFDGFLYGEGEAAFENLLERLESGAPRDGLPGLVLFNRTTDEEIVNEAAELPNLDALTVPDFDGFDLSLYESPALVVEWNRGCVGKCTFCNINDLWKSFRYKSAGHVVNELATLTDRYSTRDFSIVDPMVNGDVPTLEAICDGIIARGLDVRWAAGISPNREVGPDLFRKMRQAGCYRLEFGVESGSDEILRRMGKDYRSPLAAQMLKDAHDAGIMVVLYLIVGFPRETQIEFEETLAFLEQNAAHIDLIRSVNGLVIIHGTPIERKPGSFGIAEPNRHEPGWTTHWSSDENTPEVRAARVRTVVKRLRELGIAVEFQNTEEVMPHEMRFAEKADRLTRRLAAIAQDWGDLTDRMNTRIGENGGAVRGRGQLALVLCPVWGVDSPPLGLATVAGYMRARGYDVATIDFNIELFARSPEHLKPFFEENSFRHWTDEESCARLVRAFDRDIENLVARIVDLNRRVIGFTVYSANRLFTIEVMRRIKDRDPGKVLVVGGRGVQTSNERLLFPPDIADYFVVGEGEEALVEIMNAVFDGRDAGAIAGVDRFVGATLAGASPRGRIADLTTVPPPAYDQLPLDLYRNDEIPVQFSRGCVAHCTFCNDNNKNTGFRTRPGEHMAREVAHLARSLGRKRFRFNDLLINGDLEVLEQMCDTLIEENLDIRWIALAQPRGDMSDELVRKIAHAGCYTLNLGVEHASDRVLKRMGKGFRVVDMERALGQIRSAGINTMINFIVGFPGEEEEDVDAAIEFVRRNRANICGVTSVNSFILLEDSPIEKNAAKMGITWPDFATRDVKWVLGSNTPEVRERRLSRFLNFLESEKIPICVTNSQERAADVSVLPPAEAEPAPAQAALVSVHTSGCGDHDDGFDPAKGEPRFEVVPHSATDVLLIKCPVWGVDVAPLAIAYLAQCCREAGFSVQALDLNVKIHNRCHDRGLWRMDRYKEWADPAHFPLTYASLWELTEHYLKQIAAHPAKVIGFSTCTSNWMFTIETTKRLKAMSPDKVIVLGGPGVTNSFEAEQLHPDQADYVFFGEGDLGFPTLVEAVKNGREPEGIKGLIRVGSGFTYATVEKAIVERGITIPNPTMEELNLWEYSGTAVPLLGSRGCVRRCTFCNDHHIYQKYRHRPAKEIFEDMEWHVRNRGAVHFTFLDLLMNGHMKVLEEFCDLIIAAGYQVAWGGQAIIRKEMTPEILGKMAKAGCKSIVYGMESFNDKVLRLMRKYYTQDLAKRVLTDTIAAGIEPIINIICGFPGEGIEEFEDTYNFIRDHREIIGQVASVSPCLINLGSELFDRWEEFGVVFPENDGSVKWYTQDGTNTYEERLRRMMLVTELLAGRDMNIHTVNIYDKGDRDVRLARDAVAREAAKNGKSSDAVIAPDAQKPRTEHARPERTDAVLALMPPWGVNFPPLGIASLATATRERGHGVLVRDLNVEAWASCGEYLQTWWEPENLKYWAPGGRLNEISAFLVPLVSEFVNEVAAAKPLVVGLSTNESNMPFVLRVARRIRERLPKTLIVLGGPGIVWPVDRDKWTNEVFDAYLIGEGEEHFPALIEAIKAGTDPREVAGVEWRGDERRVIPGADLIVRDLDALPTPLFDDFPLDLYRTPKIPLTIGRGCPNRCTFCNDPKITPKYRYLSAEKVVAQIRLYQERYRAHEFQFNDLILNAHIKNVRRFAQLVIEAGLHIAYSSQAIAKKNLDQPTLDLLAKSGCTSLVFGIESFSDAVLAAMKKGYTADEARGVLERCKAAGIQVIVNLIVGFPGETDLELTETMEFLRRNRHLIDGISALSTCIVTAQSDLERHPDKYGIVLPKPEHWCQWYTVDGKNTYEIRAERLARLTTLTEDLGLSRNMTNRYLEVVQAEGA